MEVSEELNWTKTKRTHRGQASVDGVGGNVSLALGVLRVADTDVAVDVQNGRLAARRLNS